MNTTVLYNFNKNNWCLMPISTIIQLIYNESVLQVEETGVPGENHVHIASQSQTSSHKVE